MASVGRSGIEMTMAVDLVFIISGYLVTVKVKRVDALLFKTTVN